VSNAPSFLAITGPTCSRKTNLSVEIAGRLNGEVISMDSRQVYRGMDIGTDKVTEPHRSQVPHHGLDLLDPDASYSAGQFARDARRWIEEIDARGRIPMLVGGTGFFLKAILDPIFAEPDLDLDRNSLLRSYLDEVALDRLAAWVQILDPERAAVAVAGGRQRLIRTLQIALLTGRPLSWWHRNAAPEAPGIPGLVVVLDVPREELYRRINARVLVMAELGLVNEVQGLLDAGFQRRDPGMTGTGYRGALDASQRATRRYARRQLTWFRHQLPADRIVLDATRPRAELVAEVLSAWEMAAATQGR